MKLTLKNFRCYENKVFQFDNKGLLLISGQSGLGKSSILNAIQFCLFGVGKKIQSFGKTSSYIQIEFDNLIITRTKTPNRLLVETKGLDYEDDAAQSIINKYFGKAFNSVSYIQQNGLNSFILMSASEKLDFLEVFAFKDVNLPDIKDKCKNEISKRKDELHKTMSKLELTNNMFEDIKEPELVKFPLKVKESDYIKAEKNEQIKYKNCDVRIKKTRIEIDKLKKELSDIRVLETFISSKKDNIDELSNQMNNLSLIETQNEYEGDDKLSYYKESLDKLLSEKELIAIQNKIIEDTKKLEQMKIMEISKCNKELEKIHKILWIEYSKDEIENLIKDTKDFIKDAIHVENLRKQILDCDIDKIDLANKEIELEKIKIELDDKKKLIETIKNQEVVYICPSCKQTLNLIDNELIVVGAKVPTTPLLHTIKNDNNIKEILEEDNKGLCILIKSLEFTILEKTNKLKRKQIVEKEIEEILGQYEDELDKESLEEDLSNYETYYNMQLKYETKKLEIEEILFEGKFSSSYVIFEKELTKLIGIGAKPLLIIEQNKNIKENLEESLLEEDLRDIIIKQENIKMKLDRLIKKKKSIEDDTLKFNKQVDKMKNNHISNYEIIKNENELNYSITDNEIKIGENEESKIKHKQNLDDILKYHKYVEDIEKYTIFKQKVINLQQKEIEDKKNYTASVVLKEKVLEAESIAIQNIIDSINTHSQIYLDYFFPDNPIIIRLSTFKETSKSIKPQINIEIDYKGNETDLNSLSGGELSRVILAFNLALSEMFSSPILMLDECTASLDQELTTIIFDTIKENFKDKLVLIVAHQVIEGTFNEVIKLE